MYRPTCSEPPRPRRRRATALTCRTLLARFSAIPIRALRRNTTFAQRAYMLPRIMRPSSAGADIRAPTSMGPESSGFLIRSLPSPIIPVQPLTSLFVSTFAVLEGSSFVSVPLRATAFGSNLGSKGHCPFAGGPRHRRETSRA
jgi:hypothetical protein